MTGFKFSKLEIDRIPHPESGQKLFWDTSLRGFGLRVTPGVKTYIVEGRLHGKTCRVKIGRHGPFTVDQARSEAMGLLRLMAQGVNPNSQKRDKKTLGTTLAEAYSDYKQARKLRPKTVQIYDSVFRRCFPDWMTLPLVQISKEMVEERHREISEKNGPRGKGEAQAHQAMRTLRSVLNFAAVKYETESGEPILTVNPVKRLNDLKAWNDVPRRKTVIREHQLKAWASAVMGLDNPVARDFLLLLLFTGLRRSEAASLCWSDIDFEAKTLSIPGDRTKNHDDHCLPLTRELICLLQERSKVRRIDNPFIFPGDGKCGYILEPKRQIKHVIERSGVRFMCHDLRRTFLSVAESLDVSYYALKKIANHRDGSDVTAGYIVNDVERLREPMQRINKFLSDKTGLFQQSQPQRRTRRRQ